MVMNVEKHIPKSGTDTDAQMTGHRYQRPVLPTGQIYIEETLELLHINRRTLMRWLSAGKLTALPSAKLWLVFYKPEVEALVEERKVRAAATVRAKRITAAKAKIEIAAASGYVGVK
jgi:hypothetical protein